jgi:hypothetical protein
VTFRTSLLGREPRPEAMVSVSIRSISRCPRPPAALCTTWSICPSVSLWTPRPGNRPCSTGSSTSYSYSPSARVSSGAPTDWRMTLARDQLRAGALTIAQIATQIGYGSPAPLPPRSAVTTDTPRPMAPTTRQPIRYRQPATVDH